ncbi:hypothetical protein mru_1200 [Methanobrevibacter ruminantium M1]|uniref:Uncharacterized protein n=1 Tax=Methanobrevibacter ruminantium (strain ATCC 35063 / DSM 1093 / JCM 13430 / OCM 146 / M1) TaxID=634498 RepID=D3E3D9_METRM|nr:hypothetical protein [Methanobrevibacter ruminantium]ADC47050.1 hypothetical protein mru_1200 [Methanobrevibacter ruminantium M1]
MNAKKLTILAALAILAIVAVGSVSAFDLNFLGGDDSSTTTVGGIEFNIPEGYEINDTYTIENQTRTSSGGNEYIVNQEGYGNSDGEELLFLVGHYDTDITNEMLSAMKVGDEKTINGQEGFITSDDVYTVFSFAKDGELVTVTVSDESALESIIK